MNNFFEERFEPAKMATPRVLFAEPSGCLRKSGVRSLFEQGQYSGFEPVGIAGILNDSLP
jgi:hypothetical protein